MSNNENDTHNLLAEKPEKNPEKKPGFGKKFMGLFVTSLEEQLMEKIKVCSLKGLIEIINKGVPVNIITKSGHTPLTFACASDMTFCDDYADMVSVLLKANADPKMENKEGMPPLAIACRSTRNNYKIIKLLLEAGADPNERVPLVDAISYNHLDVVRLLIENGADSTLKFADGSGLSAIAKTNEMRTLLDSYDKKTNSGTVAELQVNKGGRRIKSRKHRSKKRKSRRKA